MNTFKHYLTFILLLTVANTFAQKYYTTNAGSWEGSNNWSTSTNGAGSPWSATTLVDGDMIQVDNNTTLDTDLTIPTDIEIILDATLNIQKKLRLTEDSRIEFTNNGLLVADGPGNSEKISFGGDWVWTGKDDDIAGPAVLDKGGVLPVSLLYFKASTDKSRQVTISFASASEENNDYYTIERSKDGVHFDGLTTMQGAGNSSSELTYSFTDETPYFGRSYYRLVQTDFDGTSETFDVVAIHVSAVNELAIYPNPARQGSELKIRTGADASEKVAVKIYNHAGRLVKSSHVQGGVLVSIDNADLDAGFYMVKVKSGQVVESARLVIQ